MPAGFEFTSLSGETVSYTNRRPSRIVGAFAVTTTGGSYAVPGLTGRLFAYVDSANLIWNVDNFSFPVGAISVSGSTVSWTGILPARLPFTLILGECGI